MTDSIIRGVSISTNNEDTADIFLDFYTDVLENMASNNVEDCANFLNEVCNICTTLDIPRYNMSYDDLVGAKCLIDVCSSLGSDGKPRDGGVNLAVGLFLYELLINMDKNDYSKVSDLLLKKLPKRPHKSMAQVGTKRNTYLYIRKLLKVTTLKTKFKASISVSSENLVFIISEVVAEFIGRAVYHASSLSKGYGECMRKYLTSKAFSYSTYLLVSQLSGVLLQREFLGNGCPVEFSQLCSETCDTLVESIEDGIANAEIIVREYNELLNMLSTSCFIEDKLDFNATSSGVDLSNSEQIAKLKQEIKELRRELYVKKKASAKVENIKEDVDKTTDYNVSEEVELAVSRKISRGDKLRVLKDKGVVLISSFDYSDDVHGYLKYIPADMYSSADLSGNYIVLVTKNISHSLSYDVTSDVKRIGAKRILTSRTNFDLILDDIIDRL